MNAVRQRAQWVLLAAMAVGCGPSSRIDTTYGGGSITVRVAPVGAEGLAVEGEFPGRSEEIDGPCHSRFSSEVWKRDKAGKDAWVVMFCAEDVPIEGNACFDLAEFSLDASETESGKRWGFLDAYDAAGYDGEPDQLVESDEVDVVVFEGDKTGTASGTLWIDDPCVGAEPLEHTWELNWEFKETWESEYKPSNKGGGWLGDV